MRVIKGKTFAGMYGRTLHELLDNPEYVTSPRGMKIKEICDAILVVEDPTSNLYKNPIRSVPLKYLAGELQWYFSGSNKLVDIQKYSKFWDNIANEDGTINSAYGHLIFNMYDTPNRMSQWEWALNSLIKDKDSRQAIIHFNRSEHQYLDNKDFVCTLNGIFSIRKDKLNFSIMMRSNDIHFGLTFDFPFFSLLQQQMHRHLLSHYPDLEIGTYTHHAASLHVYERDFEKLEKMADQPFIPEALPKLDVNLIDESGKPTNNFINLNKEFKFLKWMSEHL